MKVKKLLVLGASLLGLTTVISYAWPTTTPPSVILSWSASPSGATTPLTYSAYYGVASRSYTNVITGLTNLNCTITNLARGVTFYFAVTCVDTNGDESDFSNEASYTTRTIPAPPVSLRVTNSTP